MGQALVLATDFRVFGENRVETGILVAIHQQFRPALYLVERTESLLLG